MKNSATWDAANVRFLKRSSGRIGSRARPSQATKTARTTALTANMPTISGRAPRILRPAPDRREETGRKARGEQRCARVVDRVLLVARLHREPALHDDKREKPERQADEERPAPARVVRDPAARRRSDDGRDTEDCPGQPLPLAALTRRDQVADHGHRERDQAAGAEALDRPAEDQHRHRRREAADDGADHEQHDREQEERPPAVDIGQLPVQGHRDRRGQHVGGEDPRVVVEAAEVGDDVRQRCCDDRLVERREQHPEQEAREHDQCAALSKEVRAVGCLAQAIILRYVTKFPPQAIGRLHAHVPLRSIGGEEPQQSAALGANGRGLTLRKPDTGRDDKRRALVVEVDPPATRDEAVVQHRATSSRARQPARFVPEPAAIRVREERVVVPGQEPCRRRCRRIGPRRVLEIEELPAPLVAEGQEPRPQTLDDLAQAREAGPRVTSATAAGPKAAR